MGDTMPARSLCLRRLGSALCVAALLAISTSADSYARGFGGGGGGGGGRGGGGGFGGGGASFSGGGGHGGASISRSYGGGSGNAARAGGATRPGADRPSVKPPIANAPSRPNRPTPTPPRPHPGPNPPRPVHPVVPGPIPWIPGAVAWGDNYYDEDWPVVYNTPSTCTVVTVAKVKYRQCGDKFYQRAYQGNQIVYVEVQPPQ